MSVGIHIDKRTVHIPDNSEPSPTLLHSASAPRLLRLDPSEVLKVSPQVVQSYGYVKKVGAYLIGPTLLGSGSFATVKEGLHSVTGEKVAVKIIDKEQLNSDAYAKRHLRREGRVLQTLRHRSIVRLWEVLETAHCYYLLLELCAHAENLMLRIQRLGHLQEPEARGYTRDILAAVSYMHSKGVVHRDLKVENILILRSGAIKIVDFGLSTKLRRSADANSSLSQLSTASMDCDDDTQVSRDPSAMSSGDSPSPQRTHRQSLQCQSQCGSPAYAAPEVLLRVPYDHRADIWTIGVDLFAMLTGRLPFTVQPFNIPQLCEKMLSHQMNPFSHPVSTSCQHLIRQLLHPKPEFRITIQSALQHEWFQGLSNGQQLEMNNNNVEETEPDAAVDEIVLGHMVSALHFPREELLMKVRENIPSPALATFSLLKQKWLTHVTTTRTTSSGKYHEPTPTRLPTLPLQDKAAESTPRPSSESQSNSISRNNQNQISKGQDSNLEERTSSAWSSNVQGRTSLLALPTSTPRPARRLPYSARSAAHNTVGYADGNQQLVSFPQSLLPKPSSASEAPPWFLSLQDVTSKTQTRSDIPRNKHPRLPTFTHYGMPSASSSQQHIPTEPRYRQPLSPSNASRSKSSVQIRPSYSVDNVTESRGIRTPGSLLARPAPTTFSRPISRRGGPRSARPITTSSSCNH